MAEEGLQATDTPRAAANGNGSVLDRLISQIDNTALPARIARESAKYGVQSISLIAKSAH